MTWTRRRSKRGQSRSPAVDNLNDVAENGSVPPRGHEVSPRGPSGSTGRVSMAPQSTARCGGSKAGLIQHSIEMAGLEVVGLVLPANLHGHLARQIMSLVISDCAENVIGWRQHRPGAVW